MTYNFHKELLDIAHALYRKGMNANAREGKALSCHALDMYSSSKVGSILQCTCPTNMAGPKDHYSLFLLKPLHLLHFGVSNNWKEYTLPYISFQEKKTSPSFLRGIVKSTVLVKSKY